MISFVSCCIAQQLYVGDQILIDYGNTPPTTRFTNTLGGTGAGIALSRDNLITRNGVRSNFGVSVANIGGVVGDGLQGSFPIDDEGIYGDGIQRATTLVITFTNMDPSFNYEFFSGFSRDGRNTSHNVVINDGTTQNFTFTPVGANRGTIDAYHTYSNISPDINGDIRITVDDAPASQVAFISSTLITLTAATDQAAADSNVARINNIISNGSITGNQLTLAELGSALSEVMDPVINTGVISSVSLPAALSVTGTNLTDTSSPPAGMTITNDGTTNFQPIVGNTLNTLDLDFDIGILNSSQQAELYNAGILVNGVIQYGPEDVTVNPLVFIQDSVLNSTISAFSLIANTFDLAMNGSHHRTAFDRLGNQDLIEWGTYDYQTESVSDHTQQYLEAGLAKKFGLGDIAAAVSIGYSEFEELTSSNIGQTEMENRAMLLNFELDKTFFKDRLVISTLLTGAYHQQRIDRSALQPLQAIVPYIAPITGNVIATVNTTSGASNTTNTFNNVYVGSNLQLNTVTAASQENYNTKHNTKSGAFRLRADYNLYKGEYISITPRFSLLSSFSSIGEYTETGGNLIKGNKYTADSIDRTQTTAGLDVDWFVNDRYTVRFLGEINSNTTGETNISAVQLDSGDVSELNVPESTLSFQRIGAELVITLEDYSQFQLFFAKTTGDIDRNQFSFSLQNIF